MCSSTPADFRGLHFDTPTSCANWASITTFCVSNLAEIFFRESTAYTVTGTSKTRHVESSVGWQSNLVRRSWDWKSRKKLELAVLLSLFSRLYYTPLQWEIINFDVPLALSTVQDVKYLECSWFPKSLSWHCDHVLSTTCPQRDVI